MPAGIIFMTIRSLTYFALNPSIFEDNETVCHHPNAKTATQGQDLQVHTFDLLILGGGDFYDVPYEYQGNTKEIQTKREGQDDLNAPWRSSLEHP